ncbi:MAG TPA: sigma-54 dependent transcriptional regulator, partial [Vicinamibacterales bacterium]|nr:sigma-54 dependent transcriptional regulator [Vicinamibacterales bacterium]
MKPVASVLVIDDDDAFRGVLVSELTRMHFNASGVATADEAIRHVAQHEPEVALLDLRLGGTSGIDVLRRIRETSPSTDVIILTGHGSIDTAVDAIRLGAFDYLAKPCPLDELDVRIRRALERQSLQRRATLLERGLTPPDLGSAFIGESPEFRRMLHLLDRVAPTDSTVLISGETGTGKEMVAKLLHARSARRHRPFVVVECASLNEALLQSELFGHERGAFTGAERAKAGLFEVAHGGTIFLDEIGEVSVATQVKLLRVLDTSTFRHVGGTHEIHVDVRVIAATNRDLPAMVRQGLFREDLYYRLSTVVLSLPPLRARGSDIDLLARHFAKLLSERFGVQKCVSSAALEVLRGHDWPGNVRELLHVIESAMVVSEG